MKTLFKNTSRSGRWLQNLELSKISVDRDKHFDAVFIQMKLMVTQQRFRCCTYCEDWNDELDAQLYVPQCTYRVVK